MFCQKCGAPLGDDVAFCTSCGVAVSALAETVKADPLPPYSPTQQVGNVVLFFKKNPLQWLQQSNLNCLVDHSIRYEVPKKSPVEIDLSPGSHTLQMSFPYMGNECGQAMVQVNIEPGKKYQITYKPPVVVTSAGTILTTVIGVVS